MSSDYLADMTGITTPITHAGRVVYNAQRDSVETQRRRSKRGRNGSTALYKDVHDEDHSIQPYELCIRKKRTKLVRYAPNDTDIHVFSSANGMYSAAGNDAETVRDTELQFAGVASNRAAYDPNNNANEEHLAVQVGGLQTMYNTSDKEIHAGQIILWDMPNKSAGKLRIPGVRRSKMLFQTVAYDGTEAQQVGADLKKAMDAAGVADGAQAALVAAFRKAHARVQGRVIGKALSSAKSGKPFDILLGHYCV